MPVSKICYCRQRCYNQYSLRNPYKIFARDELMKKDLYISIGKLFSIPSGILPR